MQLCGNMKTFNKFILYLVSLAAVLSVCEGEFFLPSKRVDSYVEPSALHCIALHF